MKSVRLFSDIAHHLTIPAGGPVCILHDLAQGAPDADMEAFAQDLVNGSVPGMFDGLTAEEQACIINYTLP